MLLIHPEIRCCSDYSGENYGFRYKITSVAPNAFEGYTNLKSLTIGANVKKLGANMLKDCTKLTTLTVNSRKLTQKNVKNSLKGSSVNIIKAPESKISSYRKIFAKANSGRKVAIKEKNK